MRRAAALSARPAPVVIPPTRNASDVLGQIFPFCFYDIRLFWGGVSSSKTCPVLPFVENPQQHGPGTDNLSLIVIVTSDSDELLSIQM